MEFMGEIKHVLCCLIGHVFPPWGSELFDQGCTCPVYTSSTQMTGAYFLYPNNDPPVL